MKRKEHPPLTPEQQQLVVDNLRIAKFVIKKFYGGLHLSYAEWQELFSCADSGVVIAAGKFHHDFISKYTNKPVKFSTYAIWWVKQQCQLWLKQRGQRRKRELTQSEVYFDPDDTNFFDVATNSPSDSFELAELVDLCLKWVRDDYKQVLTLRYLEGLTLQEVADRLGVSKQNIQQMEVKAIRQIRERVTSSVRKAEAEHREVIMKRDGPSGAIRKLASRR